LGCCLDKLVLALKGGQGYRKAAKRR